jgi:hypothetical protein
MNLSEQLISQKLTPYIERADITPEQKEALARKWAQDDNGMTLQEFINSAQPTFFMDDAIVVKWCNMWLAIETSGHCHS